MSEHCYRLRKRRSIVTVIFLVHFSEAFVTGYERGTSSKASRRLDQRLIEFWYKHSEGIRKRLYVNGRMNENKTEQGWIEVPYYGTRDCGIDHRNLLRQLFSSQQEEIVTITCSHALIINDTCYGNILFQRSCTRWRSSRSNVTRVHPAFAWQGEIRVKHIPPCSGGIEEIVFKNSYCRRKRNFFIIV